MVKAPNGSGEELMMPSLRSVIRRSGCSRVVASSTLGKGTTVNLYLPRATETVETQVEPEVRAERGKRAGGALLPPTRSPHTSAKPGARLGVDVCEMGQLAVARSLAPHKVRRRP